MRFTFAFVATLTAATACLAALSQSASTHPPASAQLSMPFSTAALKTLRCLKDVHHAEDANACQDAMNSTEDVMRSPAERTIFSAIAQFAVSKIQMQSDLDSKVNDAVAQFQVSHPVPSESDADELAKKTDAALLTPSTKQQFQAEAACETAMDEAIRSGHLRKLADCKPWFAIGHPAPTSESH